MRREAIRPSRSSRPTSALRDSRRGRGRGAADFPDATGARAGLAAVPDWASQTASVPSYRRSVDPPPGAERDGLPRGVVRVPPPCEPTPRMPGSHRRHGQSCRAGGRGQPSRIATALAAWLPRWRTAARPDRPAVRAGPVPGLYRPGLGPMSLHSRGRRVARPVPRGFLLRRHPPRIRRARRSAARRVLAAPRIAPPAAPQRSTCPSSATADLAPDPAERRRAVAARVSSSRRASRHRSRRTRRRRRRSASAPRAPSPPTRRS